MDALTNFIGKYYAAAVIRLVLGGAGVFMMLRYGARDSWYREKPAGRHWDVVLVAFAVAVNNFPIIPLITSHAVVVAGAADWIEHIVFCLSVGFFEEVYFRGLMLPMFIGFFAGRRLKNLWAVVCSSVIFGAVHIFNLFEGVGIGAVVMQIGYSSLIGAMCGVVFVMTKNVWLSVALHTVYNIGGLMLDNGIAEGVIWTAPAVVVTVVVGVSAAVYLGVRFIKFCVTARDSLGEGN